MAPIFLSAEAIKEKRKLLANNLDRASTACLALGVLGPLSVAYFNYPELKTSPFNLMIGVGFWGLASLALHHGAQLTLNRL